MVVTNNLNVANILIQNPSFEVIVAGGALRKRLSGLANLNLGRLVIREGQSNYHI
ncbi:MAG: hypothetical protein ACPG8W_17650 [Candidatus Promineifilaceae bacterium]